MSVQLVMDIVAHSFTAAYFTIGNRVFRQARGSMIGFTLSGALSVLTVMEAEDRMVPERRVPISSRSWAAVRYVDNLITLSVGSNMRECVPQWLHGSGSYGSTVVLEYENNLRYLGVTLVPRRNAVGLRLQVPGYDELVDHNELRDSRWRYRSPKAAASARMNLSGFVTRLHSAAVFGAPTSQAQMATAQLLALMVAIGHPVSNLSAVVCTLGKKFPAVYTDSLVKELAAALQPPRQACLWKLRSLVGRLAYAM